MSTTVSMWLGVAFVALAIIAVVLQAWLWGPKYWDFENKKSLAPRPWANLHRLVGYAYAIIYVIMMTEMVPRLWEYQVELPARTVIHACMGITIGVLIITKVLILRFFKHFEESMPWFGMGILIATINLAVLSMPFAVRAADVSGASMSAEAQERTRRILEGVDFGATLAVDKDALVSEASLELGRQVLVQKCITCHDLRTILIRPRTGRQWLDVVQRMVEKPMIVGDPISEADIPVVTSYLIAITPSIQESTRMRAETQRAREQIAADLNEAVAAAAAGGVQTGDAMAAAIDEDAGMAMTDGAVAAATDSATDAATTPVAEGPLDRDEARNLLAGPCQDCHGTEELDEHGGDDFAGWQRVVNDMIVEQGAELNEQEAMLVARFLAETRPKTQ